jgi:ribosomal protein L19
VKLDSLGASADVKVQITDTATGNVINLPAAKVAWATEGDTEDIVDYTGTVVARSRTSTSATFKVTGKIDTSGVVDATIFQMISYLHVPVNDEVTGEHVCNECGYLYPCTTRQILDSGSK